MATYIIPIFCFGLVITGIVFLGIQQASDLAKQLAAQQKQLEPVSMRPQHLPLERNSAPTRTVTTVIQP